MQEGYVEVSRIYKLPYFPLHNRTAVLTIPILKQLAGTYLHISDMPVEETENGLCVSMYALAIVEQICYVI